jgi:HK97 family phage major capsid protein
MTIQEMQAQHDAAVTKAEGIVSAAERTKRPLTTYEQQMIDRSLKEASDLQPKIAAAKAKVAPTRNTDEVRALLAKQKRTPHLAPGNGDGLTPIVPNKFSREYFEGFYSWLSRRGPLSAAMYEGSSTAGGYATPIVVDDQIVPLAPQDSALRRLATVIPTKADIKTPQAVTRGAATPKSETSAFTVAVPSLAQFTLSAFPAGAEAQTSFELAGDAPLFNVFVLDDMATALLEYEETLFLGGSGVGQAQGLLGNVSAPIVREPDSNGNVVSINATLDLLTTLKDTYHKNASFLMSRLTSILIRKAQVQTNLFVPVFTRVGNQDFLHGYPCEYSSAMPAAARGNTPVLFGDFKRGYLIGDRGGSALRMMILDQANAAQGLLTLLGYRRTDGRVRVAEAIQALTIAAS